MLTYDRTKENKLVQLWKYVLAVVIFMILVKYFHNILEWENGGEQVGEVKDLSLLIPYAWTAVTMFRVNSTFYPIVVHL